MELAIRCRDSDDWCEVPVPYGSEWTVGAGRSVLVVAFPGSVRQQVLEPSDMPCNCLLYTSPSPRDLSTSRMPSSA